MKEAEPGNYNKLIEEGRKSHRKEVRGVKRGEKSSLDNRTLLLALMYATEESRPV